MNKEETTKEKVQVVVIAKAQNNKKHLLRLKTNKRRGNFWQNITGGVDPGESFIHAAVRELKEETTINVEASKLIDLDIEYQFRDRWENQVTERCYFLYLNEIPKIVLDPSEHQEFVWDEVDGVHMDQFEYESNFLAFKLSLEKVNENE